MPRPRNAVPTYRLHSPTGRAVCTVYDAGGTPREVYLGAHGTADSRARYARLCDELQPGCVHPGEAADATVSDVILAYWRHAEGYYGATTELSTIKDALRVLRAAHGDTPAAAFGPLALKAVRENMVAKGWSRPYCNRQARRIVRVFRWAVAEEMVSVEVYHKLETLDPLVAGKTAAPETPPVLPADPLAVAAALPFLPPHARALVELLRLTGMRPSEACRLTLGQVDRSAAVWVYSPTAHKTAHKGKGRAVHFGAAARAVLTAHLGDREPGPDEAVFSPRRQRADQYAAMRSARKSKVQPSQASRKKAKPERVPGEQFTPHGVGHAVAKACRAAGVPAWTPYQLRYLVASEVREKFSIEHARAVLGHSHASMTAHYSKSADLVLAGEVAIGTG